MIPEDQSREFMIMPHEEKKLVISPAQSAKTAWPIFKLKKWKIIQNVFEDGFQILPIRTIWNHSESRRQLITELLQIHFLLANAICMVCYINNYNVIHTANVKYKFSAIFLNITKC